MGLVQRLLTLRAIFGTWKDRARDAPAEVLYGAFNDAAITVVFSHIINHRSCLVEAAGLTDAGKRISAIGVGNSGNAAPDLILPHEIGHALGMDHPTGACSNNLMCASSGNWTRHIPACQQRDGATLTTVPHNCVPAPTETVPAVASCAVARKSASGVVAAAANPIPMEPPPAGGPGSGTQSWRGVGSGTSVTYDSNIFTEGAASLVVAGSGYRVIESAAFRTADWLQVGSKLAVDVYVPPSQPNPSWLGSLDLFLNIPAAGIYNASIGHTELTPFGTGVWTSVELTLPETARLALLGDYPQGTLSIAVNTPGGAPAVLLDNLRVAGEPADRTVFHAGPTAGGLSSSLLSFDTFADWSILNGGSRPEVERRTGGTASLGVTSGGYTEIVSRPFAPSELPGVTSTLSVDVFVPAQQPNPWWIGSLQAFVSCPASNVNDAYLGEADLTHLFRDEFNTITFPGLPSYVTAALAGTGSCRLKLALNTPTGAGEYLLDNLAFR